MELDPIDAILDLTPIKLLWLAWLYYHAVVVLRHFCVKRYQLEGLVSQITKGYGTHLSLMETRAPLQNQGLCGAKRNN